MRLREANSGYGHDASYLRAHSKAHLLIAPLDSVSGGGTNGRRRLYEATTRFREIFNVGFAEQYLTPALRIGYHFKEIRAGRSQAAIAMYLAWLCHKHPSQAAELYVQAGLSSLIEAPFRRFIGDPDQAAAVITDRTPSSIAGPGIRDEAEARLTAHQLVEIERKLNRLRYGDGADWTQLLHLRAGKSQLIGKLHFYVCEHDASAILQQLGSLYTVGHWSDRAAHESVAEYSDLVATGIEKAADRTDPDILRLILDYAQNHRVRNDPRGIAEALSWLPSFRSLGRDQRTAMILRDRADYVLEHSDLSAEETCDSFLKKLRGTEGKESASIWRCEACLAVASGRFEVATNAVKRARALLKAESLSTREDRMIPQYLDAIELIIALRTGSRPSQEIANALDAVIRKVREIDPLASAFIAGLYHTLADILFDLAKRGSDRSGEQTAEALSVQSRAFGLLQRSVKLFCIFDMPELQKAGRDRLERYGYLDPDPFG
ncbi:hypothetical protein [Croceibacterium ferulae]|uniref:hypothetical protein n=1 Tax=Croceibacterium ferulae TaxID=1854641 RepID=UPI000EACE9CE|nr:hypothetical protein [Croceibacterium ferulae]